MFREPPGSPFFPTRRSSDLLSRNFCQLPIRRRILPDFVQLSPADHSRSEEHTSELQSQSNLVFPLLFFKCSGNHRDLPSSLHDALPIFFHEIFVSFQSGAEFCQILFNYRRQITQDRKSTRLNSSHSQISYSLFFFLNVPGTTGISLLPYTTLFRSSFTKFLSASNPAPNSARFCSIIAGRSL